MKPESLPNFIIGGVAAAGTSFLASALIQHPQIYLPARMRPEPHFFFKSWEYAKGFEHYLNEWFPEVPDSALAVGERSSSYLYGGLAVARKINAALPKVKLIFTLRNPVERTWANYRYTVLQGLEDLSFIDALERESQRVNEQDGIWAEIQPHDYTGRGFYGRQLSEYLEVFPRDQILLVKSELLGSQTEIELRKIYDYLGLTDRNFMPLQPPNHTAVNVSDPALQMKMREHFGPRFDQLIEAVRRCEDLEELAQDDRDLEYIRKLERNMKGEKESMPDEARRYLKELFAADIEVLEQIVDFDVTDWK